MTLSDPHRAYTVPWWKSCSAKANKQHKDSTGQRGEKQGMLSRFLNIPCICDEFLRSSEVVILRCRTQVRVRTCEPHRSGWLFAEPAFSHRIPVILVDKQPLFNQDDEPHPRLVLRVSQRVQLVGFEEVHKSIEKPPRIEVCISCTGTQSQNPGKKRLAPGIFRSWFWITNSVASGTSGVGLDDLAGREGRFVWVLSMCCSGQFSLSSFLWHLLHVAVLVEYSLLHPRQIITGHPVCCLMGLLLISVCVPHFAGQKTVYEVAASLALVFPHWPVVSIPFLFFETRFFSQRPRAPMSQCRSCLPRPRGSALQCAPL